MIISLYEEEGIKPEVAYKGSLNVRLGLVIPLLT